MSCYLVTDGGLVFTGNYSLYLSIHLFHFLFMYDLAGFLWFLQSVGSGFPMSLIPANDDTSFGTVGIPLV